MNTLLRKPYRAQELAAMGVVRRWQRARAAAVIGECGTGKTLVALAAVHCHAEGRPYTALAMVPGHLTAKMARETFQTLPRGEGLLHRCLARSGAEWLPVRHQ
jgi:N12 class adenine-specific DNA methylase